MKGMTLETKEFKWECWSAKSTATLII